MKKLCILFLLLTSWQLNAQTYEWTNTFGGDDIDNGWRVAVDPTGNVFIGGTFSFDSVDFNPGPGQDFLYPGDGEDIYLAKYDANGNYIWAHTFENNTSDVLHSMAIDSNGDVYITGYFGGTVDFDPSPATANLTVSTGSLAAYLAKYDNNGNYLWAIMIDGSGSDRGHALFLDPAENICITGVFSDVVDFDPSPTIANLTSVDADWDAYIAKYDPAGNYLWAKSIGGTGSEYLKTLYIDNTGYIYVSGYFGATCDFDPSPAVNSITTAGGSDVYFAKYDANGNYIWAKAISSTMSYEDTYGIVADNSGNVYIAGHFGTTTDFDPSPAVVSMTTTNTDVFLAKYDVNGNYIFANRIVNGTAMDRVYHLTKDSANNLYVSGSFRNTVDFDPGPGSASYTAGGTSDDFYFAKYNSSGNFVWVKTSGSNGEDVGKCIALSPDGSLYFTGWFSNTVNFNPDTPTDDHTSNGLEDIFLTTYSNPITAIESEQNLETSPFKVYPNPTTGILFCETLENTHISIYNSTGELVLSQSLNAGKNVIDISSLSPGIYLVRSNLDLKSIVVIKQ